MDKYLIVGLGNPGILYENTRHNIGFKVVKALAKKYDLKMKNDKKLKSKIAEGSVLGKEIILQMPMTYMNLSGQAVGSCVNFFKLDIDKILVVTDDADIAFEEFRLKKDSSCGGHNGLKSIEASLNTQGYSRLRVGIGRFDNSLKEYVLRRFSKEEKKRLPKIIDKAVEFIELWLEKGIKAAEKVNIRLKNHEGAK